MCLYYTLTDVNRYYIYLFAVANASSTTVARTSIPSAAESYRTETTCGLNSLNGLLHLLTDHSTDHGSTKQHTDQEDNCCHLHDLNRKKIIKIKCQLFFVNLHSVSKTE